MHRFLVCSDIHRDMENFKYALREASAEGVEGVFIAGDTELSSALLHEMCENIGAKLYLVRGNCDYSNAVGVEDLLTINLPGNHKCLLTHGHRQQVKSDTDLLMYVAQNHECDLAIYGHTHMYDDSSRGGVRLINPGSLGSSFWGSSSYILMTIDNNGRVDILKRVIR